MLLIRDYAGVKAWGEDAQEAMEKSSEEAGRTLEDIADIINVILEQLVRQRFELPAFLVLQRAAQHARAVANRNIKHWFVAGLMRLHGSGWPSCSLASMTTPRAHGTG